MKTRDSWNVNGVYHRDVNDNGGLPACLHGRGICEIEIVFNSQGYRHEGDGVTDYDYDEVRTLVEVNAYAASDEIKLSKEEQAAVWDLWKDEVERQPLS